MRYFLMNNHFNLKDVSFLCFLSEFNLIGGITWNKPEYNYAYGLKHSYNIEPSSPLSPYNKANLANIDPTQVLVPNYTAQLFLSSSQTIIF